MRTHVGMRLKRESGVAQATVGRDRAKRRRASCGENFWSEQWNELRTLPPRKKGGVASTSRGRLWLRIFGVVGRVRWANKALEPTTMAVTPRAIASSVSHAFLASARGAPAMVVAHL
jgi:hypothetical protein